MADVMMVKNTAFARISVIILWVMLIAGGCSQQMLPTARLQAQTTRPTAQPDIERAQHCDRSNPQRVNAADALHYGNMLSQTSISSTAVCWFYISATQGNAHAQAIYALMELNGTGTPVDHSDSFVWAKRAAEQDDYYGDFLVTIAYIKGDGVAKDPVQAEYWRKKAVSHPEIRQMAAAAARKQLSQQNRPTDAQVENNAIAIFLDDYIGAPMRRGEVGKAMSNLDKLGAIPPVYPCDPAERRDPRINCKSRDEAYDAWEKKQEADPIQK